MNTLLNVLFFIGLAAICFFRTYWSVGSGVLPLRYGVVRRAETPLIFWTLIVMFVALGSLALSILTGVFDWIMGRV